MKALMGCVALLAIPAAASAQWTPQQSNTTAEFRGLMAVSPTVVWASGTRGRVARTTDGGATWKLDTIPGADSLDLRSIAPRSATTAVAMVAGEAEKGKAKIYRMTDGAHWTEQFDTREKGAFLDAIAFWDDQHGIALGDPIDGKLFILTTDDGGASWTRVATANSPAVLPGEGSFAASGTCLTVLGTSNAWIGTGGAARARVFRSTDRGRTWTVADTPIHAGNTSSGIFSVAFSDAKPRRRRRRRLHASEGNLSQRGVVRRRRADMGARAGQTASRFHVRGRLSSAHRWSLARCGRTWGNGSID